MKTMWLWFLAVAFVSNLCLAATPDHAQPAEVLRYLPEDQPGIAMKGESEHHIGSKALFDYMDGGAERYLAYGFGELGVQNYTQGEAEAVVEIYQMASAKDAFGIYAGGARGEHPKMGATATAAPGIISFFKDRYYVRVVALSDPSKAAGLLFALAKATSSRLPGKSNPPSELQLLPKDPVDGSLRYLPNLESSRTEWFSGEGEALFCPDAWGVLGWYRFGDKTLKVTRMTYPDAQAAVKACQALATKLGMGQTRINLKTGSCSVAGKTADSTFTSIKVVDRVLRWVANAPDSRSAQRLIGQIR